jgi:hypothetical protein
VRLSRPCHRWLARFPKENHAAVSHRNHNSARNTRRPARGECPATYQGDGDVRVNRKKRPRQIASIHRFIVNRASKFTGTLVSFPRPRIGDAAFASRSFNPRPGNPSPAPAALHSPLTTAPQPANTATGNQATTFSRNSLSGLAGRQSPTRSIVQLNNLGGGKITNLSILIKQRTYQPFPLQSRTVLSTGQLTADLFPSAQRAPYHAYHAYHAPFPSARSTLPRIPRISRTISVGRLRPRSQSAKPSRPPATDCRSIRSGVSFMVMSKATAAMLLLKNSLPSAHSPRPQGSTLYPLAGHQGGRTQRK